MRASGKLGQHCGHVAIPPVPRGRRAPAAEQIHGLAKGSSTLRQQTASTLHSPASLQSEMWAGQVRSHAFAIPSSFLVLFSRCSISVSSGCVTRLTTCPGFAEARASFSLLLARETSSTKRTGSTGAPRHSGTEPFFQAHICTAPPSAWTGHPCSQSDSVQMAAHPLREGLCVFRDSK